ncbi:MAG: non-heme iron oxygenase ferredoxin subunit [Pseudomonadota bacterium]
MGDQPAMTWHAVGRVGELGAGEARQVRVGGFVLALYNVDGTLYATDDTCTHAQASLSEGYIEEGVIECPLHQGRYDIASGKALSPPVTQDLRTYPVKIVGEEIHVATPAGG